MADIFLDRLNEESIRVQPKSVHGMLWLQVRFDDETWDHLCLGLIGISAKEAVRLSQQAELCGLRVLFP